MSFKNVQVNQKHRINILRIFSILLFPSIIFTKSGLPFSELTMEIIENIGILLIIAGVLGRLWSILYIGGRKNSIVMKDGPYSLCRHPLYLFSTMAVLGFGLMLGSLILTSILTTFTFLVLVNTAKKEEKFLLSEFGLSYEKYMQSTPRIFPKLIDFSTPLTATFNSKILFKNFKDGLAFLALIPFCELIEYFKEVPSWPTIQLF